MHLESTPAGLSIHVGADARPGLRLESSRSRRMRLVADGESVFWARIENGYYGVWALRRETKPAVVRAIRADEARAGKDMDGWMRWFAQELQRSDASPLGAGRWTDLASRTKTGEAMGPRVSCLSGRDPQATLDA